MDEWKLKCSLIDYPKTSHAITVPEGDIKVFKYKDLKTRRREDYVARGSLFVLDLGFLSKILGLNGKDGVGEEFSKWRKSIVSKMDGMELSIELRERDDFEGVRKEWEEMAAFGTRETTLIILFSLKQTRNARYT